MRLHLILDLWLLHLLWHLLLHLHLLWHLLLRLLKILHLILLPVLLLRGHKISGIRTLPRSNWSKVDSLGLLGLPILRNWELRSIHNLHGRLQDLDRLSCDFAFASVDNIVLHDNFENVTNIDKFALHRGRKSFNQRKIAFIMACHLHRCSFFFNWNFQE